MNKKELTNKTNNDQQLHSFVRLMTKNRFCGTKGSTGTYLYAWRVRVWTRHCILLLISIDCFLGSLIVLSFISIGKRKCHFLLTPLIMFFVNFTVWNAIRILSDEIQINVSISDTL